MIAEINKNITEAKGRQLKVKFHLKAATLVLSIIALSWFFEGVRQLKQAINLEHIALLTFAVVATIFLVWIQSFWIYLEEKSKGTLKKTIGHFERLEQWLKPAVVDKDEQS